MNKIIVFLYFHYQENFYLESLSYCIIFDSYNSCLLVDFKYQPTKTGTDVLPTQIL